MKCNACKHQKNRENSVKKWYFPIIGLFSSLWVLFRVLTKPSRISYPCVQAASPLATGFLTYIGGLLLSTLAFKKARQYWIKARYVIAGVCAVAAVVLGLTALTSSQQPGYAVVQDDPANQPMGVAQGIHPGRVVWVHNADATNENCTNTSDDYWWEDKNNNLEVIENMLSDVLQNLTGEATDEAAWDALFKSLNQKKGLGDNGYQEGQKVGVKINLGCEWSRNNWRDNGRNNLNRTDSTPFVVLAVLKQLVNKAGVPQANIGVGDPIRDFKGPYFDLCHDEFPDIEYWAKNGGADRTRLTPTAEAIMFYSDGEDEDKFYQQMMDLDYLINVPVLKAHARAGVTIGAKNHFGSHARNDAMHLHRSLPDPDQNGRFNGDMGSYRCFVDILGHEKIGGNTMLTLVDAIWASSEATDPPIKWQSAPFNDDWPNSLLASQDLVAIESVGFDFLYEEFTLDNHPKSLFSSKGDGTPYPQKPATQDYMHQAADPANWPDGVNYDPENDGTILTSLGVHEHWNNAQDKAYTRNLGTGEGIELVKIMQPSAVKSVDALPESFSMMRNYPNPFNPVTTIHYQIESPAFVRLTVYNSAGQAIRTLVHEDMAAGSYEIAWHGMDDQGRRAASGLYIAKLQAVGSQEVKILQQKMLMLK